ncbi:hypothetical protein SDC9_48944 [bioreactor metagenome]|uniref:Uncharacterized protein n=1 Tax=bioreactor metagenome TaxID=1076179 RepID=A0A644WGH9_9ZZZZ
MKPDGGQEHGRRGAAGNGEGEQGDHGAADDGVVGHLGADEAFIAAGAEEMSLLGAPFAHVVGKPASDVLSGSGDGADDDADDSRADRRRDEGNEFFHGWDDLADFSFDLVGHFLLEDGEELGDPEDADERRNERKAALKLQKAEGEPRVGEDLLHAHHGGCEAEEAHDPPLEGVLSCGEGTADHDAEEGQQEEFPVAEPQGDLVDEGGEEDHDQNAEEGTHEGGDEPRADGKAALALLRQGEAVEAGGRRRWGAGDVDHDGRVETSGDGPYVHGEKKGHGVLQGHAIGEVDQQGQGHGGRESGDRSHEHSQEASTEDQSENCRVEGSHKGDPDLCCFIREKMQYFHDLLPFLRHGDPEEIPEGCGDHPGRRKGQENAPVQLHGLEVEERDDEISRCCPEERDICHRRDIRDDEEEQDGSFPYLRRGEKSGQVFLPEDMEGLVLSAPLCCGAEKEEAQKDEHASQNERKKPGGDEKGVVEYPHLQGGG